MQATAEPFAVIETDTHARHERTQAMLAKYKFDLIQPQWPNHPFQSLERVAKPIRMRVRYTCHKCKTSFRHDTECRSCRHRRCVRCDRYPPRKPRPTVESQAPTAGLVLSAEKTGPETTGDIVADLVCTCHECQTPIDTPVEVCPTCSHQICDRCLTEPQMQGVEARDAKKTPEHDDGAGRISSPEEQKLPPDVNTTKHREPVEAQ